MNLLTCRQISFERTNGPFKETYGKRSEDGFIISFERRNNGKKGWHVRQEFLGKNVERTKQVSYEHYDILLRNKF